MVFAQELRLRSARHPGAGDAGHAWFRLRTARLSGDLGADARQGSRLLYLDGPPRRRLDQPDLPEPVDRSFGLDAGPRQRERVAEFRQGHAARQRFAAEKAELTFSRERPAAAFSSVPT